MENRKSIKKLYMSFILIVVVLLFSIAFYVFYYDANLLIILAYFFASQTVYVFKNSVHLIDAAKVYKSKRDCINIVRVIEAYNLAEETPVQSKDMVELLAKYLPNLKKTRDAWGNRYEHDQTSHIVFSKGPDGLHDYVDKQSRRNVDDIIVNYDFDERKKRGKAEKIF